MSLADQNIPPPRESGFTTAGSHPLYWARWGTAGAPVLLVIHGGPGAHHDYMLPQMLSLADEYDLLFYDQRGGGRSKTDGRDTITWQTHVEDLGAVARELVGGPLSLIGYSWGGLLSMLYASAASEDTTGGHPRVARMALIAPAAVTREHRRQFEENFAQRQDSEWVRDQRSALVASGLRESQPDAYRKRAFELSVAGYFANPERARELTPFRVTSRVQQSVWDSLGDWDARPALRSLRVPSIVLHGTADPIPVGSSREIAAALGAEMVVLDGCGHVPYVECASALFSAIRRFLRETPAE
jgi:proline iminopeptidase